MTTETLRKESLKLKRLPETVLVIVYLAFLLHLQQGNYNGETKSNNPMTALSGAAGVYDVTEFRLNGTAIPYSPLDTIRWQSVVWENCSALSFVVNRTKSLASREVNNQLISSARRFYDYDADTLNQVLYLQDQNQVFQLSEEDFEEEGRKENLRTSDSQIELFYRKATQNRIVLWGTYLNNDSIFVVLDRVNKTTYPIKSDRTELPEIIL